MVHVLEKTERRLGEKLFLKGDRCAGAKCAAVRRAYPPGVHGKAGKRRQRGSEYGALLKEKQKVRFVYGLDESDISHYSKKAIAQPGVYHVNFLKILENRLDNAVFRLGFADSRRAARQAVNHGHIKVGGRVVDIPSYQLKKGEHIRIKESSAASPMFRSLETRLKKYTPPKWLHLDKALKEGTVMAEPDVEEIQISIDPTKIREFYSR